MKERQGGEDCGVKDDAGERRTVCSKAAVARAEQKGLRQVELDPLVEELRRDQKGPEGVRFVRSSSTPRRRAAKGSEGVRRSGQSEAIRSNQEQSEAIRKQSGSNQEALSHLVVEARLVRREELEAPAARRRVVPRRDRMPRVGRRWLLRIGRRLLRVGRWLRIGGGRYEARIETQHEALAVEVAQRPRREDT